MPSRIALSTCCAAALLVLFGPTACDDDRQPVRRLTVSRPTGKTSEAGAQASFTVVLNSAPRSEVTVTLESRSPDEGIVAPAALVFTSADWNAPQTVTVSGVDDDEADGDQSFAIKLETLSEDPGYGGVKLEDVTLINTDDDTAGITVSLPSGATSEAGGQVSFTVVLNSKPTSPVTIKAESADSSEGVPAPSALTFKPSDWNAPQKITVRGVDDDEADGERGYAIRLALSSSDSAYAAIKPPEVRLKNIDDDSAGVTVGAVIGVASESGEQASFTVVLNSRPTADVVFELESSDEGEGTLSPTRLSFSRENWNAPQTVSASGVDDDVKDGHQPFNALFAAIVSQDKTYARLDVPAVQLVNVDDETADVRVSTPSGPTTETGGTATFTVVLSSRPAADVRVALESSDVGEGISAPEQLVFTAEDWNAPQTVTVTGIDDAEADGHQPYVVRFTSVTSEDTDYDGLTLPDVGLTNIDDERAGISIGHLSGPTSEDGGQATIGVSLLSRPGAEVAITVESTDRGEGTVAPARLVFPPENWDTPQTVTLSGVDDDRADGHQRYAVRFNVTSADDRYHGMVLPDVIATNIDNETAGVRVSAPSGPTTEGHGAATFTVVLTSEPRAEVVVALESRDETEGRITPTSLVFTPTTWSVPQTVTVTGVDDDLADGNQRFDVAIVLTSADSAYQDQLVPPVACLNLDDDRPGINVTNPTGMTSEAGGQVSFSVVLASRPTAPVTLGLDSNDVSEGTVSTKTLTFTSDNWSIPQPVTVTGVDDLLLDHAVQYAIVFTPALSADSAYAGLLPASVLLRNADDETATVRVSAPSGTTTTEAGGQITFTVELSAQPKADVTLELGSDDATEGSVSPDRLTFSAANWNVPRVVAVTGLDDRLIDGDVAYRVVFQPTTSNDGDFVGIVPNSIALTNSDDDVGRIIVSAASGDTSEKGAQSTFTVVLASQPVADVVLSLQSDDPSEGTAAPGTLTFTPAAWDTPQTVTVTGVDDALPDGPVSYAVTFGAALSADPNYQGLVPTSVPLINRDDDATPVTVVLDEVERGWWDSTGDHTASNNNTYTGLHLGPRTLNSYFIFDLGALSGTIVSAELRLEVERWYSADTSEDVSVWDVSTDPTTLEASGFGKISIFDDLQSGHSYGKISIPQSSVGKVVSTTLDARAVSDLNSARGKRFAVGVTVDTISRTNGEEAVRFSASSEARVHQLVLQIIP